jgi:nucleoside-diphosphate-sugar epimerase
VIESVPGIKERIRGALGSDDPFDDDNLSESAPTAPLELLEFYARQVEMRAEKARRVLGFQPLVDRQRALELTVNWLQHARYLPSIAGQGREAPLAC